jgi:hypothetical protein
MALGFAGLDNRHEEGPDRPIEQYLYGSEATIFEVQLADGSSGRPWPVIRVQANWPGGMSGGPVFNEEGNVIGLVSTGVHGSDVSSATYFSGWDISQKTFGTLDASNPGWIRCWGVFRNDGDLVAIAPDAVEARAFAGSEVSHGICSMSVNLSTGDYIRFQNPS